MNESLNELINNKGLCRQPWLHWACLLEGIALLVKQFQSIKKTYSFALFNLTVPYQSRHLELDIYKSYKGNSIKQQDFFMKKNVTPRTMNHHKSAQNLAWLCSLEKLWLNPDQT